jgi:uncharacterized membrane protein (DUF2068 family)
MVNSEQSTVPLGIKIVCGFGVLEALLGVITVINLIGVAQAFAAGIVLSVIVQVAVVYGLWTLERWGWFGALILNGLDILLRIPGILNSNSRAILFFLLSMIIVVYLISKRDLYRGSTASS